MNFKASGRMGDFIHSLYVAKNLCLQQNTRANIYLEDSPNIWKYGIKKAYDDVCAIVLEQP
jgi:hypothetical protein